MLRLIYGGFGSGKSTRLLELIRDSIEKNGGYDKRIYMIVPEQDTVRAELEASEKLPPSSALCFEVVNFSRLANTVFRSLGGLCYNYADSQSKALCMWQSLHALGGLISEPMEEVDEARINSLLSVISELRASGVGTTDIEKASKLLDPESALSVELRDLALITAHYDATLAENYSDSEKDLDRLGSILEKNRFFSGAEVYIDGFSSFTYPQIKVIGRLIADCASVTVTLPYDRTRGQYSYCRETEECERTLLSLVPDGECVREDMGGFCRSERDDIRYLAENLYRVGAARYTGTSRNISLYECTDAREEAEAVCSIIKRKIHEGSRYRDIAVVARSAADYAGILDASFDRHGIPCFFSCEVHPESHPVVKLVYCAFSLFIRKCRAEDVISYLKTGLCDVTPDECDLFEKYIKTWKINGERLISDTPFVNNPSGYTDSLSSRDKAILECVNRVRGVIAESVRGLFSAISGERTVCEMCVALWQYIEDMDIPKKLKDEADIYASSHDEQSARECEGVFRCLADTVDTLCRTVGDERVDASDFLRLLRLSLRTKTVSVIPTSVDAVTVGSANMLRTAGIKHVIVIGASDGRFPCAVKDGGYFDNIKRRKLSEVGIHIEHDIEREVSTELFYYSRAVCSASESVAVLYSATDVSSSSARISNSTLLLADMMGLGTPVKFASLAATERIYDTASLAEMALGADLNGANAESKALRVLASEGAVEKYELQRLLSPDIVKTLYPDRLAMTQARLESYVKCHFSYLANYILRLDGGGEYDFSSSDIGNFVHAVLDTLTGELTDDDGVFHADIPKEELDSRTDRIAREYLLRVLPENDARSARLENLMRRIRHSVSLICDNICREFCVSAFTPIAHEMEILDDSPFNPTPLSFTLDDGRTLSLYGILDRADAFRKDGDVYVRVIDYKTGIKDFKLDDVRLGLNLQLMIYLFTLCSQKGESFREMLGVSEEGRILPAGMLYYSASVKDLSVPSPAGTDEAYSLAQKELKRKGLLTNEEFVLRAMEPELEGEYIPVKVSKGSVKAAKAVTLIPPEEFDTLYDDVQKIIKETAGRLCSGEFDATPLEHNGKIPCRYCEMKPICRHYDEDDYIDYDEEEYED